MTLMPDGADVLVVGGGLAGLAAAAWLARGGARVLVCERSSKLGGRAATHARGEYRFNLGAHALYADAAALLGELGVTPVGQVPPPQGAWALAGERLHTLPVGLVSLLTTGLLPLAAKREVAGLLAGLHRLDAAAVAGVSLGDWVAEAVRQPTAQRYLHMMARVASYTNDPAYTSAGVVIAQLQQAVRPGVLYLDGGWQRLVDGLADVAGAAGVRLLGGARVVAVEHDHVVRAVHLADGRRLAADQVIIAGSPAEAAALAPGLPSLGRAAAEARPVRAACLDVALEQVPRPRARLALGFDRPLYYSLHSATARLAPAGGGLVHLARYLDGSEAQGEADGAVAAELEGLLERMQPGWRAHLVERRYLPAMTVMHAVPRADRGGLAGRPAATVPEVGGLYVAGDWVGPTGLLAGAALASARAAALAALARLASLRAAA